MTVPPTAPTGPGNFQVIIIVTDNGSEFTSRAFDAWAYARGIKIDFSAFKNIVGNYIGGGPVRDAAETAEKMIRKMRVGMMPPLGARRPEAAQMAALVTAMESRIDAHAAPARSVVVQHRRALADDTRQRVHRRRQSPPERLPPTRLSHA